MDIPCRAFIFLLCGLLRDESIDSVGEPLSKGARAVSQAGIWDCFARYNCIHGHHHFLLWVINILFSQPTGSSFSQCVYIGKRTHRHWGTAKFRPVVLLGKFLISVWGPKVPSPFPSMSCVVDGPVELQGFV